jgi:hypothetical protein
MQRKKGAKYIKTLFENTILQFGKILYSSEVEINALFPSIVETV